MPAATAREAPRFVRRTTLGTNEYHTNFRKVDCETISRLTSDEATRVTSQMCKVYLSLLNAPPNYLEREGVLRFAGEEKDGGWVTAWEQLVSLTGVASATASKALRWMHEQGIVGYFAGKNGAGIRVFINRAASSIGTRTAGKKILEFTRASSREARASSDEAGFNDSFAVSEVLETDRNPRAPKNGAGRDETVENSLHPPRPEPSGLQLTNTQIVSGIASPMVAAGLITEVLLDRLKPMVHTAAAQAAAHEHERTREWLESRGLPKAARVAQREAYNVLRQHGLVGEAVTRTRAGVEVGRGQRAHQAARQLSQDEVRELAETCVAMLEVHGQSIDVTLAHDGGKE